MAERAGVRNGIDRNKKGAARHAAPFLSGSTHRQA
jgi:hypothetical protein